MKKQAIFLAGNIKHLRKRKGLSQEELAQMVGITRGKLALIESGKTVNPLLEDVIKLSGAFGIGVDSFLKIDLTKVSEIIIKEMEAGNDIYATGTKLRVLATTVDKDNQEKVEFVPEKAKAGYRSGYSDPEWIENLPRYSIPGLSPHSKYRIFPISGDSMLPYPDGCYIVGEYVENWLNLKDDTLCILILKSEGTDFVFKQVENWIKKKNKLLAKSLNLRYLPFEISISDILEVWKYKLHIANIVTCPSVEVSSEELLRTMQQIKIDIEKLASKV